ncbi:L,D-transpeptidase family protein [Paenibacillus sp. KQZ6P-2]|uniref:L,D-transpeptidase family protein n=1 Tax=Paenibacillus mangrovi TaxID=2931978 RepID=A0A9X2B7G3_9BACL|nr:L,D-transpeptidase family protein [Paenibacillus mangrovi]MCJ8014927.1 L,D-transpeptidase family protein [Paenibacillus mangrovi]
MLLGWIIPAYVHADTHSAGNDLVIINKKTNKLAFFQNGSLVKVFPVATGKTQSLTPEGSFEIVNKIKNRPYYKEKIPGGDPRNPLGDRWIGLDVNGTKGTTYAIHGNSNKNAIGKYVSAGCIRMFNDDIHWLFDKIQLHTTAIITSSKLSFEEIAQKSGYHVGEQKFEGRLLIDNKEAALRSDIVLYDSRIYIPLRACVELLGGEVLWNNQSKKATLKIGDRTIVHQALSDQAVVNGKTIKITASRFRDNSLMLPLRNFSELSGYTVQWDNASHTVSITTTH